MKINTIKKLLSYFVFIIVISLGFSFINSSMSLSNFEVVTSTTFTDYFFPDPKKKDGKRQFSNKLCWKENQVENRIKQIIKDFNKDPGYKKNQIGRNPDVGWHKKTDAIIFRSVEKHKKTYSPNPIVKISTYGDCE